MIALKFLKFNGIKGFVVGVCAFAATHGCAWDVLSEMEAEARAALTNAQVLSSADFTNKLHSALDSQDVDMRLDASILLAINKHQLFLDTAEELYVLQELQESSNAVTRASSYPDKWQYRVSMLLFAGTLGMDGRPQLSYVALTNSISECQQVCCTNEETALERCILDYYEFHGASSITAMKILAGANAADIGLYESVTNYANQVPPAHATQIIEHLESVIAQ